MIRVLTMNQLSSRLLTPLLLLGLGVSSSASAYNEGGHYYTLLALFGSGTQSVPEATQKEIKLEALCAELPDLALELDAITQRVRVLQSMHDNLWGLLGMCQSSVSSHMVAAQYYLHGLTGTPASQLRTAAKAVLQSIDADLQQPKLARKDRLNLVCARGFAAHLYGDTFAHVRLSSEHPKFYSNTANTEMYATGLGHARDGHVPDYLYGHSIKVNQWPQWVKEAAAAIAPGAAFEPVLARHNACNSDIASCEKVMQQQLAEMVSANSNLAIDMKSLLASGNSGIGQMERATSCDSVLNSVYAGEIETPQCATVWSIYLSKAIPVFYAQGIDASSRQQAGNSCSAWRCKGEIGYAGEAPGNSCAIEVVDELHYGIDPP